MLCVMRQLPPYTPPSTKATYRAGGGESSLGWRMILLRITQPPLYQQRGFMKPPTMTQRKLLDVIIHHIEQTGSSPTVRYLATEMGFKSTNAVRNMLDLLKKKGHVAETTQSNHRISLTNKYRTVVVRPEGDDE
jgi:tRNA(Glu) U13 pseudouridine synthase TruD